MEHDLKKAQDLLNVDFQQIVDAVLEDNNFEPLNKYIRQLQRHQDEMWSWSSLTKFEARHLFEQYIWYQDSVDIERRDRKYLERSMRVLLGDAIKFVIVGSPVPAETEIANELFEEWEHEDTLHDIAEIVCDDLSTRLNVAQDILEAIEDYQAQFGSGYYDDDILMAVCDMMFDEIDRVKDLPSMLEYEDQINQMARLRKKFRQTRRQIQLEKY